MDRFILMSLLILELKTFPADARYVDGKKKKNYYKAPLLERVIF